MNELINLTPLVLVLLGVLGAIATRFIIKEIRPLIDEKITAEQRRELYDWTQIAVKAAEQAFKNGEIKSEERKIQVKEFLMSKGYEIDLDEINNVIEGMVYDLPSLLLKDKKDEK